MKAELPELEMIRRDLEREVVGRKVKEATASGMAVFRRYFLNKRHRQRNQHYFC